ncbi:MAG: N-6 DNA methylase [Ignavibacteriae bacterium]|nr:N-6 DNA methylase [Ignavibacteriota bacterium]
MASLNKEYSEEKLKGKIYTPFQIVDRILDEVGYFNESDFEKKILDPACGDGRFLIRIVNRIIDNSKSSNYVKYLSNIYGWDIDEEAVFDCKKKLDDIVKPLGLKINWNISVKNSLYSNIEEDLFSEQKEFDKYSFIVGNPPYIRIQHLEEKQRKYIQKIFHFCSSGSTDIYIAFFELAIKLLDDDGICGFITPNTYLYTETAKPLRKYFAITSCLIKIYNYGNIQLFENATTYSAITIFNKKKQNEFIFLKAINKDTFKKRIIESSFLNNEVWNLSIDELNTVNGKKLKDICKIHVGITTLLDKAYMMKVIKENGKYVWVNSKFKGEVKIEKGITKPLIKASRLKKSGEEISEVVLFPYKKVNGKNIIIPEDDLKKNFPNAYDYLLSIREELDKRDNGNPNPVKWYAFGRSQGLDTSFGKKILFSPMNIKPNFIYSDNEEATFYSGYCIKYDGKIENLLKQLNSSRMEKFIEASSRDFRGGWKAYNKKVIENFEIDTRKL